VSLLGNLLFPLIAFAGLFLLFRRAGDGSGGGGGGPMGGMGGPMDFGRSKSKFQEIPETGVMFDQVAGCDQAKLELQVGAGPCGLGAAGRCLEGGTLRLAGRPNAWRVGALAGLRCEVRHATPPGGPACSRSPLRPFFPRLFFLFFPPRRRWLTS
jgi:hypothetical protein